MAGWLDRQLPEGTRIVCSPARRCEQTALALGRKYKLRSELAPDTTADALLAAAGWPNGKSVVLLVGHQPSLGKAIALLLGLKQDSCPVRKGAVWWIRTRERDGDVQTVVVDGAVARAALDRGRKRGSAAAQFDAATASSARPALPRAAGAPTAERRRPSPVDMPA